MSRAVVVFRDGSLGGTSRSALMTGRAWASAGYRVGFVAGSGVHDARRGAFLATGEVLDEMPALGDDDVVHYHHGVWTPEEVACLAEVAAAVRSGGSRPVLLTHNVFGEPLGVEGGWPGPRGTGLLGPWLRAQYLANTGFRPPAPTFVVPNPQDTDLFRRPSPAEREAARAALGAGDRRVLLRLGSPVAGKWSSSYEPLVASLGPDELLVCVGIPKALHGQLAGHPSYRALAPVGDDEAVRRLYWAADVFALDAEQGESFGNVVTEALLSGVPVVYRSRPYRDNTPHQFAGRPDFHLARDERDWVEACRTWTPRVPPEGSPEVAALAAFGVAAVGRRLAGIHVALRSESLSARSGSSSPELSPGDLLRVLVRHNPPFMAFKRALRRTRSLRATAQA